MEMDVLYQETGKEKEAEAHLSNVERWTALYCHGTSANAATTAGLALGKRLSGHCYPRDWKKIFSGGRGAVGSARLLLSLAGQPCPAISWMDGGDPSIKSCASRVNSSLSSYSFPGTWCPQHSAPGKPSSNDQHFSDTDFVRKQRGQNQILRAHFGQAPQPAPACPAEPGAGAGEAPTAEAPPVSPSPPNSGWRYELSSLSETPANLPCSLSTALPPPPRTLNTHGFYFPEQRLATSLRAR